jgi:predicted alpha/beta hydrolase family esterase
MVANEFTSDDVYVVGYDTRDLASLEDLAQRLLRQLHDQDLLKYQRVYFITHSMGGLIVKRILNILNTGGDLGDLRRIRAVLLISTPSQGAPIAELARWFSMNPKIKDLTPADFNTFLQSLENDYTNMIRQRNQLHENYPRIFCAYETQPTKGFRVVSRVYASTWCDETPYTMNYNHVQIVKPRDTETEPYPWAKARFQEADQLSMTVAPP